MSSKIYKAGTKIILHSSCNYGGCAEEDELTLEEDYTEDELNAMATEFATETVQVEGWFTVAADQD